MSGDVIDLAVKSFYKSGGTVSSPNSIFSDVLSSLASGIVTATSASHGVVTDLTNPVSSPIYTALNNFLPSNDPNTTTKPKAYLNWILLDDQFKGVNTYPQSGTIPVGTADVLNTLAYSGIPITKNGYLYIWVSNETQGWDVFFDNLSIQHRTGPIREETHYYPFGLTMAGISSKALNGAPENKYRWNKGSELQNKEFSDGSGLELYATNFRSLDPQLGRWWQIDPKPDYGQSLYSSMNNNPILHNDPLGDTASYPIVFVNPKVDPIIANAPNKAKSNGSINVYTHGTMYTMLIKSKNGETKYSGDVKEIADAIDRNLPKNVKEFAKLLGTIKANKDVKYVIDFKNTNVTGEEFDVMMQKFYDAGVDKSQIIKTGTSSVENTKIKTF